MVRGVGDRGRTGRSVIMVNPGNPDNRDMSVRGIDGGSSQLEEIIVV